ncbi:MAG TPA: carboxypeptidase regulatory-like domain-containing protein [bacterium]|nr:carboxypeptidase regulatory-like domain-containing protein [bacterium]HPP03035.1 carboxypeptidase regulatory-like domain-containing protein [bacterium]
MRSQVVLIIPLALVAVLVMGLIVFLPTDPVIHTGPESEWPTPAKVVELNQAQLPSSLPEDLPSGIVSTATPGLESQTPGSPSGATGDAQAATAAVAQASPPAAATPTPPRAAEAAGDANAISGVVKDSRGVMLQGAAVQAEGMPPVFSGVNGVFKIVKIAQPAVTLTASLAGFQPLRIEGVKAGTTGLELVLVPNGAVAGQVLDQFGEPVAFAKVTAQALQGIWIVDLTANAEGRFQTEEAPQVRLRLQATQEGFTDEGEGTKEVDTPAPQPVILKLIRPTFSISGRVVMRETQQGVAGFRLRAAAQDTVTQKKEFQTETDGTGYYKFDNLERGTYQVSSVAKDNAHLNAVIPINEDFKNVRLFEKSAEQVNFYAVSGLTVNGIVVSFRGEPVSNAEVTVAGLDSAATLTGRDGRFRLQGVPMPSSGQDIGLYSLRLTASHDQYGTGLSEPLSAQAGQELQDITITLQGLAQLAGNVVDRQGAGIAGARVVLRDLIRLQVQETQTDSAGAFLFANVSSSAGTGAQFRGTHEIEASKDGSTTPREQLVLQPAQENHVTLVLDQNGFIEGRVTDSSGAALPGVLVRAILPYGGTAAAYSNEVGIYRLTSLPEGTFDLMFRLDSNPPLTGTLYQVPLGTSDANITLTAGEWYVMGTVFDNASNEPVFQYFLNIEGTPLDRRGRPFIQSRAVNTPDGTYQITLNEPGQYRVRFTAPGYHSEDLMVKIAPDTLREQYLNPRLTPLNERGAIQGSFIPPEGMEFVGVNVLGFRAFPAGGHDFLLEDVPAGQHDLLFLVRDRATQAGYPLGVLPTVRVVGNEVTNLGMIPWQRLTAQFRDL